MKEATMMDLAQSYGSQNQATHTCPVWIGYLLASPVRRLFESPGKMVLPLVRPGDRVLELGPALGFFTVPLARAVGPQGKVICVDVQRGMLDRLGRRLQKRGLLDHVELRRCSHDDFGLGDEHGRCDLALALHVVHETAQPAATLRTLAACLRPGGQLLLVEPAGHVSREAWQAEVAALAQAGLVRVPHPRAEGRKLLALWRKPAG
jgi:ubiquinone/menaquinone biosynthesis C-methylase UbiE